MSNPFKYGTVVCGKDFADRQQELKELADRLKSSDPSAMLTSKISDREEPG